MRELSRQIARAGETLAPMLISGERGTGKRAAACSIHHGSPLSGKPFLAIECRSLILRPTRRRGAEGFFAWYTGVAEGVERELGCGGTLFLNEAADLPAEGQSAVWELLQRSDASWPDGAAAESRGVRVIAATSRDLRAAVECGAFRKDLFDRLAAFTILLPPLRLHKDDIPELVNHFLDRCRVGRRPRPKISGEAMRLLTAYDWPGNIRELENCVARALALSSGPIIYSNDLPSPLHHSLTSRLARNEGSRPGSRQIGKRSVLWAVGQTGGNKLRAAELLGIGRSTLYRKLKQRQGALADLL